MMFGCNDDVAHPGRLDELYPAACVEFVRPETSGDFIPVRRERDAADSHDVLRISGVGHAAPFATEHGIRAPMNEATEPRIAPPLQSLVPPGQGIRIPTRLRVSRGFRVSFRGRTHLHRLTGGSGAK